MKVSHLGDEHLLRLTSEEVALLVDLCHAAIFSDELGAAEGRSPHMRRFMADMVSLMHDMGAAEFARQYEWWTMKSQPNAMKRTDLPDIKGSDPAQGVQIPATAIDVVPMEESRKRLVMRAGTVDFHLTIGSSATAKSLAMALTA